MLFAIRHDIQLAHDGRLGSLAYNCGQLIEAHYFGRLARRKGPGSLDKLHGWIGHHGCLVARLVHCTIALLDSFKGIHSGRLGSNFLWRSKRNALDKFAKAGAAVPGDLVYARESLSEYLDKVRRKQTKVMQKYGEALQ